MGIRPMFKLPTYNVFDYKPRTYNPELERRRDRLRQMREQQGKDMGDLEPHDEYKPGNLIKGNMRHRVTRKSSRTNASYIRLFVILAFLFFLAYMILTIDLSPIVSFFNK